MPKKRNKELLNLKPVLHVYCEGKKTEPNYLKDYIERFFSDNRRLQIVKVEDTKKNTPKELVNEAIKKKKDFPDVDVVWVVYDRESINKYSDELHSNAYKKAKSKSISIALSNVCFEVWLLLHFVKSNAPYSCYEDLRKNSLLRTELEKRGINDYEKGDKTVFQVLTNQEISDARIRAKSMNSASKNSSHSLNDEPYKLNPYTDVYLLLDAIDTHAKEHS